MAWQCRVHDRGREAHTKFSSKWDSECSATAKTLFDVHTHTHIETSFRRDCSLQSMHCHELLLMHFHSVIIQSRRHRTFHPPDTSFATGAVCARSIRMSCQIKLYFRFPLVPFLFHFILLLPVFFSCVFFCCLERQPSRSSYERCAPLIAQCMHCRAFVQTMYNFFLFYFLIVLFWLNGFARAQRSARRAEKKELLKSEFVSMMVQLDYFSTYFVALWSRYRWNDRGITALRMCWLWWINSRLVQ